MIFLLLAILAGVVLTHGRRASADRQAIALAVAIQPISAPVYVAYAKGFFAEHGLDVTLRQYWLGKDAQDSVILGQSQFCTVAETPLMFAGLKGEKIAVVATIADSNRYMKIVARKDRGILGPADLAGKRIGASLGTTAQYFLHAFLTFNCISHDRVRVINMKTEALAEALVRGDIDAAVSWNPHATRQGRLLGPKAITLENATIYKVWWNVVGRQDYVTAHPATVERLLEALIRAQHVIEENPGEAKAIMEQYVGKGEVTLSDFNFDVRLGQALILDLEDQARWAIRERLTDRAQVPNYLHLMYSRGLKAVAPDSVALADEGDLP